jgi:hypothetical protein
MMEHPMYDTDRIETRRASRSAEHEPNSQADQEVAAMAQLQVDGVAAQPAPVLAERENQRAVDLIEAAERDAPYCLCGSHMLAVAHGNVIWLECSNRTADKPGIAGVISRITALGHTRRMIMELPTTQ